MKDDLGQYMDIRGLAHDVDNIENPKSESCDIFVDCGATFDAVSPEFCEKMGYAVIEHDRDLALNIGNGQQQRLKRRITTFRLQLPNMPFFL